MKSQINKIKQAPVDPHYDKPQSPGYRYRIEIPWDEFFEPFKKLAEKEKSVTLR
ncbi:MAG TPA: hypothetical protein VGM92_08085 [Candidatus Kapabacteria bacterium]|jgi:hypothetical protein